MLDILPLLTAKYLVARTVTLVVAFDFLLHNFGKLAGTV